MLVISEAVQLTDTGRQREANEDSFFARAPVFAVADGMGGAQAGEVASRLAVEAFDSNPDPETPPEEYLRATVELANRKIFEHAQGDTDRSGMGTTLTAAVVRGDEISFGHVGDSRAYVFRDGKLKQITNDHSLVEELRRQGRLTKDQAAEHPQRSVITRALGPEPRVEVDTMTFRARPGDVFLLCSDGLTTMLDDAELLEILKRWEDLGSAARKLVRGANDRGGRDNITVVLFRVEEGGSEQSTEGATLIGPSAAEEGFTAEAVRAGVSEQPGRSEPGVSGGAAAPPKGRRQGRLLKGGVALLILAALVGGAILGARQVWFLGADEAGRVTLYRGLPYEGPLGIDLYSEVSSSPTTLEALPEERRPVVVDHELRSRDDAVSLIEDLERAAEREAAAQAADDTGAAVGGSGSGANPGSAEQGGAGGGSG